LDKTTRDADRIVKKAEGKVKLVYGIETDKHLKPE
jgi:hypothetical protein